MNLVTSAQTFPDQTAQRMDGQVLTYAELDEATARLAQLMTPMGIEAGDRIGLMVSNVPEFGLVCYAALRSGAAVVPMNPLLKECEIAYYLWLMESLPKGPTGKILRREVKIPPEASQA